MQKLAEVVAGIQKELREHATQQTSASAGKIVLGESWRVRVHEALCSLIMLVVRANHEANLSLARPVQGKNANTAFRTALTGLQPQPLRPVRDGPAVQQLIGGDTGRQRRDVGAPGVAEGGGDPEAGAAPFLYIMYMRFTRLSGRAETMRGRCADGQVPHQRLLLRIPRKRS